VSAYEMKTPGEATPGVLAKSENTPITMPGIHHPA
jgi:hypothetical protein